MNKTLFLLFFAVLIIGCTQTPTNVTYNAQIPSTNNQAVGSPSQPSSLPSVSQMSKYATFEAEVICDMMNNEDVVGAEARAENIAKQNGFAGLADAQAYGKSVPDQEGLKMQIGLETQRICPDLIEALNSAANK